MIIVQAKAIPKDETSKNKIIETPVVSVDEFHHEEKMLIIHSHINMKGKMVLNK